MQIVSRTFLAALLGVAASLAAFAGTGPADAASAKSPREIYQALNGVRVDPAQVFSVSGLRLRRDTISMTFSEGTIGFLQAYDGRVTGAVFSGIGHVSANLRDPAEKKSLAHFLGVPLLEHNFSGAYMRFDDGTAEELREQLRRDDAGPKNPESPESIAAFVEAWNKPLPNLNPEQSSRLLMDWVAETPAPYFYAEVIDDQWGAYDILVDSRRSDNVMIGQERWASGKRFYDVWASYQSADAPAPPAFAPISYSITTTIQADHTVEGTTAIELRAERGGERGVTLELSRFLTVESVQDADGQALDFFQNEAVPKDQIAERGSDLVLLFLPEQAQAGGAYRLRVTYRGNVISDAGNGILFVGDRGSWYPHIGGMGQFAAYDTTFRWPRKLQLVATGEKIEEHEEGDFRVGHWRSEQRIAIAGFNLGQYRIENMQTSDGIKIEVAASAALENDIADRLRSQSVAGPSMSSPTRRRRRMRVPMISSDESPTPVAGALKEVGQEIADAIDFEEQWMGPFPYRRVVVSQVPGEMGQGFPGLLYLPSLSYLPVIDQQMAGISDTSQESLNAIVPYHEVAHQWWGNMVGWDNYRDQWLTEGLANYIALVGADAEKPGARLLEHWLELYRKTLTVPDKGQKSTPDDAGPLVHGYRLNSSRDPDAYRKVVYGKATWVFHMLRMMLQDPASKNPDERFMGLLHGLLESNRYRALTTEEFQKAVERVVTPSMALEGGHSMDWFFVQYVRSTGVPGYEVEYSVRPGAKGVRVRGKLIQTNVPDDFVLRVPIYGQGQSGKPALLGYVVTSGEETPFQFESTTAPKKLLIDPQMTLLCLPAASSTVSPSTSAEQHDR
jgi:Peptidase family M1 domain